MTIPMVKWATVFNAAAATATVDLHTVLMQPQFARSLLLEINGGSTPDWTLDIQGRVSPDATWHNIDYFRTDQGAAVAVSSAQIAMNWTTAQHYVVPNPPPFMRLVGTRTGGTLTVFAAFSSEAYSQPFTNITPGVAATNLGKKEDEAHTSGDVGVMLLGVANDTSTGLSSTTGDYTGVAVTTRGAVQVVGGSNADDPVRHGPVVIGGRASTAVPTAMSADGDSVWGWFSREGAIRTEPVYLNARVTTDGQIKGAAGVVHTITLSPTTATPTAGLISVYDSLTETGTIVFSEWFFATDQAHSVILDTPFSTGLYVGYDATAANVSVTVTYR